MQENPLKRTMFPNAGPETEEEEITWHASSFRESFEKNPRAYFRKVCVNDRTPVEFTLWTLDQPCPRIQIDRDKSKVKAVDLPRSSDIHAWREISQKLAAEKRRVLKDSAVVWSKSIYTILYMIVANTKYLGLNVLSSSSAHQRRGCGSMLLAWGCEQADRYGSTSFVMASPEAVEFYERFGYKTVGDDVQNLT